MPVRRLDPVLIDRIAAGEVIERPSAAVKELVENALDAGARRIEVVLEAGGRRLIRVTDDGHGMDAADLELAVERHATSKLPDGDLTLITTLGFRGEALPSIASVARLAVATRGAGAAHGWGLTVDAGLKGEVAPRSMATGTRIEVRDLFYATPARLKFLKSDRAEALAVSQMLRRLAMANPETRFVLAGDNLSGFDYAACPPGAAGQLQRLGQVLGRDFRDNSVAVEAERDGVRLEGFAGLPTFNRATSAEQYLFVNGRPVRDKLLQGAVRGAYHDTMSGDRHAVVALFVTLDPREVDVNVHPAKAEVRFRDPGLVRGLIVGALRLALANAGHRAATTGTTGLAAAFAPGFAPRHSAGSSLRASHDWRASPFVPGLGEGEQPGLDLAIQPSARAEPQNAPPARMDEGDVHHPLGAARAQLHGTYIVSQTAEGMLLVDQHAAHERLVYERLKRARAEGAIARQMLLIPAVVELDEAEAERVEAAAADLEALGLVLEGFGPGAVLVREVPAAIARADVTAMVRDLAAHLAEWQGTAGIEARADYVLKTFACHHSIRAGRSLRIEEMNALLREMEATPGSGQCNHGRPTWIALGLKDIERLFGR